MPCCHRLAAAFLTFISLLKHASAQPSEQRLLPARFDSWLRAVASAGLRGSGPSSGKGPYVVPAFTATLLTDSGKALGKGHGTYFRDAAQQRWRLKTCSETKLFHPHDLLCFDDLAINVTNMGTSYNVNQTLGRASDTICRAMPGPYYDMFDALAFAKHMGSGQVDGQPCEVWTLSAHSVNISACVTASGLPLQWSGDAFGRPETLTFSNFTVGEPSSDTFQPSEACSKRWPMPPCPGTSLQELQLYRVQSAKEPKSLLDKNVGDALGDMAFFCDFAGFDTSKLVTGWSVQANSSWGQYGYCLFTHGKNKCYGNTANHVGRESAMGLGKGALQGQCSANDDVGSWYSMPSDGLCAPGAEVGRDGCTWTAKPLRTVSAGCIFNDRGLKATCEQERGHAPMLRSAAIFRAAMESSDASKGGCPDAGGAEDLPLVV